jgi:hypothetical protein
MKTEPPTTKTNEFTLVRPGVGAETFVLPEGATLADLLSRAQASTDNQMVFLNDKPLEESVILEPGMVVTLSPSPRNARANGSWRGTVGMFRDDAAFNEMVAAGRAIREAEREAAREDAGQGSS